jgi:hypothetical protein
LVEAEELVTDGEEAADVLVTGRIANELNISSAAGRKSA